MTRTAAQRHLIIAEHTPPINSKGHLDIILLLQQALFFRRELPAFSRGQIYYDFAAGKVRIGEVQ